MILNRSNNFGRVRSVLDRFNGPVQITKNGPKKSDLSLPNGNWICKKQFVPVQTDLDISKPFRTYKDERSWGPFIYYVSTGWVQKLAIFAYYQTESGWLG